MEEQRVLIIDANLEDRGLITAIFQEHFATPAEHVLHARSGAEAEAILQRSGDFHWLFLDPALPDMEGLELLERIQPRLTCGDCRQVVVSARRDKAALVTAAGLGVRDYIVKPLDWDRTLQRLRRLAYGHERRNSERVEVIAHYNVAMEFPGCPPYAGRLVDLSMGGAQVKGPAFEHGGFIWGEAHLFIIGPCGQVELDGALLVRAEADRQPPDVRLGFRFPRLEPGPLDELARFLGQLKKEREEALRRP